MDYRIRNFRCIRQFIQRQIIAVMQMLHKIKNSNSKCIDKKIQSNSSTCEQINNFVELLKSKSCTNSLLTSYLIILRDLFGGFDIVKREYTSEKQYKFIITQNFLPYNNILAQQGYDDTVRHQKIIMSNKSYFDTSSNDKFTKNCYPSYKYMILITLSTWYYGKRGHIFDLFELMYKRFEFCLPTCIYMETGVLSERFSKNIFSSLAEFQFSTENHDSGSEKTFVCLNVVEFYFILFINYLDSTVDSYSKVSLHTILMQNYISCFLPVKDWMNFNQKMAVGISNLPIVTFPEIFEYIRQVEGNYKKISNYTTEFEYFLKILTSCYSTGLNENTFRNFSDNKTYAVPSISMMNYFYQISYRILLSYKYNQDYLFGKNSLINETYITYTNFIKYFITKSLISSSKFEEINCIFENWLIIVYPQSFWNFINQSEEISFINEIIPIYIYGYNLMIRSISKISNIRNQIYLLFKLLDNYKPSYFKFYFTHLKEERQLTSFYDINGLHGFENMEFKDCFFDIFNQLNLLFSMLSNPSKPTQQLYENTPKFSRTYDRVLLMINYILNTSYVTRGKEINLRPSTGENLVQIKNLLKRDNFASNPVNSTRLFSNCAEPNRVGNQSPVSFENKQKPYSGINHDKRCCSQTYNENNSQEVKISLKHFSWFYYWIYIAAAILFYVRFPRKEIILLSTIVLIFICSLTLKLTLINLKHN